MDSALVEDKLIDDDNNLHIVLDRREDIIYRKYNFLFNPVSDFKSLYNTPMVPDSKIAIRNNYIAADWRDFSLTNLYG